jgi:hypothetical protein
MYYFCAMLKFSRHYFHTDPVHWSYVHVLVLVLVLGKETSNLHWLK